jgi:hypothetical protein
MPTCFVRMTLNSMLVKIFARAAPVVPPAADIFPKWVACEAPRNFRLLGPPPFSLQNPTQRLRRLPALLVADVG